MDDIAELQRRIGAEYLGKRLRRQTDHEVSRFGRGGFHLSLEELEAVPFVIKWALKACGLYGRATRNSTEFQIEEHMVSIARLPSSFSYYRILHLSDLHLDGMLDEGLRLREILHRLKFDLCVITGDFRFLTYGSYRNTLMRMEEVMASIRCPDGVVGILGNHDYIEMVPGLESIGVRMLLNEALSITKGHEKLWVVGVDDAHYYHMCDLRKAMTGVPSDETKVLLAHSPEIIEEAKWKGVDLYLCGHSHGGQLCLPGGVPLYGNSRCSRKFISGSWEYKGMKGYTSRGTGSSGLSVRLSCRPEIILHQLCQPSKKQTMTHHRVRGHQQEDVEQVTS